MSFYDRYVDCCKSDGIEPASQYAADLWNVTRATVSAWKKNGNAPRGDIVARISAYFNVSADYLLELTDEKKPIREPYTAQPKILSLYSALDADDQQKALSFLEFMLTDGKYQVATNTQAGA